MYFCEENVCERQTFYFYPLETTGFFLIFICLVLSSAVGLGNTTINVGLSFLLLQIRHADAYPLVSIAVFSSSLIHFALSFVTRSKQDPNLLMVEYGMLAAFLPLFIAGNMIGSIGVIYAPYILIMTVFVIVSAYLIHQLLKHAKEQLDLDSNSEYNCINLKHLTFLEMHEIEKIDESGAKRKPTLEEEEEKLVMVNVNNRVKTQILLAEEIVSFTIIFSAVFVALFTILIRGDDSTSQLIGHINSCSLASLSILGVC